MTSTDIYLDYMRERAAHLKREQWFWTFRVWCILRGHVKQ
jgi:hypothetical protein